jgi:hypothetical protein
VNIEPKCRCLIARRSGSHLIQRCVGLAQAPSVMNKSRRKPAFGVGSDGMFSERWLSRDDLDHFLKHEHVVSSVVLNAVSDSFQCVGIGQPLLVVEAVRSVEAPAR